MSIELERASRRRRLSALVRSRRSAATSSTEATSDSEPGAGSQDAQPPPSDTPRKRRLRPSLNTLANLLMAGGLGALVMAVMHTALIDDSYITLVYARNLAFDFQWGLLPSVPANTATAPLNVMILGAITAVVRDPMIALWVVVIVNPMVMAAGLLRLGRQWQVGSRLAWVGVPIILLNPLLASTYGMETLLAVTVLVWLVERASAGSATKFGWVAGIAGLLRPDLVVVVLVVWLLHPALRRPSWWRRTLSLGWRAALVCGPWYVFSWIHFGSAVPDTLAIKQGQDWGHFWDALWGRQRDLYPSAVNATLVLAVAGLVLLAATPFLARTRYRPQALSIASLGIAGLAYYGTFCLLGVPPYFWYYGLPIAALSLGYAWGIAALSDAPFPVRRPLASALLCALMGMAVLSPALVSWQLNLSRSMPLREAPQHGNWALPGQYKQMGLDLAERYPPGTTIRSAGEFGTMLYYCKCTLLDRFDSRALIMNKLIDARESSPLMALNYYFLHPRDYPWIRQDYYLKHRKTGYTNEPGAWNTYSPTVGKGNYTVHKGQRPADLEERQRR